MMKLKCIGGPNHNEEVEVPENIRVGEAWQMRGRSPEITIKTLNLPLEEQLSRRPVLPISIYIVDVCGYKEDRRKYLRYAY